VNQETFSNISKIIERDTKVTTYKFALLRGVIDIILENSPYIRIQGGRATIPTGLLVEKWMVYYYPIFDSEEYIPQIYGNANIAFRDKFLDVIRYYKEKGGLSVFYNDLKYKGIPQEIRNDFLALAKKMADTIVKMPMRYIGRSISDEYYSIFTYEKPRLRNISQEINLHWLIHQYGFFSIPIDYFEAFRLLGSFMNGKDSIFLKWAEFSVNAATEPLAIERVIGKVLISPITDRDVFQSKKIYKEVLNQQRHVYCVWTGALITRYEIDHMIPFSAWKNNDLWNLLPASPKINRLKRTKIPDADTIEKQKDIILHYWDLIDKQQPSRFKNEMQLSLLGEQSLINWHQPAIKRLKENCDYLINTRGFAAWHV